MSLSPELSGERSGNSANATPAFSQRELRDNQDSQFCGLPENAHYFAGFSPANARKRE